MAEDRSNPTEPLISIGDLSEQVGVPVDTLRTWERRYGVPQPERLPSGHRRYRVAEIERLRLVAQAVANGHRAASALQLDPDALRGLAVAESPNDPSDPIEPLLDAVRSLDGTRFTALLDAADSAEHPLSLLEALVSPLLNAIGDRWARGDLAVMHEHFASERLSTWMSSRWRGMADANRGRFVVCAAVPGERHALGLHMAAWAAAAAGNRVLFLGADTPLNGIVAGARSTDAVAVLVSVSLAADRDVAHALIASLRQQLPGSVQLVIGGGGAPPAPQGCRVVESLGALRGVLGA